MTLNAHDLCALVCAQVRTIGACLFCMPFDDNRLRGDEKRHAPECPIGQYEAQYALTQNRPARKVTAHIHDDGPLRRVVSWAVASNPARPHAQLATLECGHVVERGNRVSTRCHCERCGR